MLILCFLAISLVAAPGQGQSADVLPASTPHPPIEAGAIVKSEPADPPPPARARAASLTKSDAPAVLKPSRLDERNDPPPDYGDAPAVPEGGDDAAEQEKQHRGLRWKSAAEQTLLFLGIQHGYAFTQPKTRRDMSGPFFKDYFRSVASIGKWDDGGKFFTNYVAHPMQGALLGFVWVQNDPEGKAAPFGRSKAYRRSRVKALAWSAVWSTQFELGPVSQASIGNVGLHGKQTWVDIVITPTAGAAWLVAEDALDRFVVRRIERRTDNRFVRIIVRMLLNPTRSSANLLRFEKPWRRDR